MAELRQYNQLVATAKIPVEATLLASVSGNTDGVWAYAGSDSPTLVTIEGVGGAYVGTVTLYGSTQAAAPANADNSRVLLLTVANTAEAFSVPQGYRWIKARVTGYGGGVIYAGLVASG